MYQLTLQISGFLLQMFLRMQRSDCLQEDYVGHGEHDAIIQALNI